MIALASLACITMVKGFSQPALIQPILLPTPAAAAAKIRQGCVGDSQRSLRQSSVLFAQTQQTQQNQTETNTPTAPPKLRRPKRAAKNLKILQASRASRQLQSQSKPQGKAKKEVKKKVKQKKAPRVTFSDMFERLKTYQQTHGHCLVNSDDPDHELFKWTRSIRKNYKHQFTQQVRAKKAAAAKGDKNKNAKVKDKAKSSGGHKTRRPMLSESKTKLLQSVNFCWDVQGALWDQRYKALALCYESHGNSPNDIPLSTIHAQDSGLAIWLQNQRRDYRLYLQDLPSTLTHERVTLLEDLGVVEDYQTQQEAWAQHYQYLVEFDQKHGHVNVPQKYYHPVVINVVDAEGEVVQRETMFSLGHWCMNQRSARRRWDSLHLEQEGGAAVGDPITISEAAAVNENNDDEQEKKKKSKSKKKGDGSNVFGGDGKNIISAFRIRMLDALDFSWNERDTKWQDMLRRLKDYYQRHGHLKVPTDDAANQDLRNWLVAQRHFYQRQQQPHQSSPMTEERIDSIEGAIPDFSWKARFNAEGGPSKEDWSDLFTAMRDKGIAPGVKPKEHWFQGINPFAGDVKSDWSEKELENLWHQKGDDDDDDGDDDEALGGDFAKNDFYVNWEDGAEETMQKAVTPDHNWEDGAEEAMQREAASPAGYGDWRLMDE